MENEKKVLPLVPLRGVWVFPYMVVHLDIGRRVSVLAIEDAMVQDKMLFLATQREAENPEADIENVYEVGTIAKVKQILKMPDSTMRVLVEGIARARAVAYIENGERINAELEIFEDNEISTPQIEALSRLVIKKFERYIKISKKVAPDAMVSVSKIEEAGRLADIVASHMNLKPEEKQELLEALDIESRLEKLIAIIDKELQLAELEKKISGMVRQQIDDNQKEYYLREQVKAIQKELGDKSEAAVEAEELRERLKEINMPDEVRTKAEKELERLERMPPMSAEIVVLRNYLDWLLEIPWNNPTKDCLDIKKAEKILAEDHYALQKPKERILEFLAIRKLAKKIKGPIICLVGPPGVGKTSLAKSIARAMDRNFVRMSLGGVRDEAEIRGHRRTYVGALPGRIIQGMRQAGSSNPVFLLDEIDKMSMDFRGDPSAALLEVLDSEQNNTFRDHYLEVPYDLSNVMFITTANSLHNIPGPLMDRMEVINLAGYTEDEKLQIALKFLLPKQAVNHGLKLGKNITVSESALLKIIREYTREAGVRNLERQIASICRKVAREVVGDKQKKPRITARNLEKYLGIPRFRYGVAENDDQVGVVTGLAWTEVGGTTLEIEVTTFEGKGTLTLTGQLGDVMKESVKAAYSFVRSRAEELGLKEGFYEKTDIHVHVPEGAIPKDGPSAGITMATALASALSGRKVRSDVAMTGEITLRGRVLPIGGLKEKVLAAHRAGIKTIILPADNKKDMEDIPAKIRGRLQFVLVRNMDEVLPVALVQEEKER